MIDLGAAADLRVGINYVPNEFLLDPRYAPPEQYIMSTQVILAPLQPIARNVMDRCVTLLCAMPSVLPV